ncbi:MAG: M23 family metallopeptidase, partial [Actinobacteria bacterium]|nr:M23 family metallopeptidase [Actinomycetota bacterium]
MRAPRITRTATALLLGLLLLTAVGDRADASSASARAQRDAARRQRQQLEVQINLARSTDTRIQAEVNRLTDQLRVQTAKAASAQQAAQAALARRTQAERQFNDLSTKLTNARKALVSRAVSTYMEPSSQDAGTGFPLGAQDINESARRQELFDSAQGNLADDLDQYRKDQEDLSAAKVRFRAAESAATHRAALELAQTLALNKARQSQSTAHDALQKRIDGLLEETRVLAAQENELQSLIRTQDAQYGGRFSGTPSNVGLIWPLHGTVTSEFGPRWGGFHPGIDIAAPYGAPIHAAKAGVVILASYYGGYGNFVL